MPTLVLLDTLALMQFCEQVLKVLPGCQQACTFPREESMRNRHPHGTAKWVQSPVIFRQQSASSGRRHLRTGPASLPHIHKCSSSLERTCTCHGMMPGFRSLPPRGEKGWPRLPCT